MSGDTTTLYWPLGLIHATWDPSLHPSGLGRTQGRVVVASVVAVVAVELEEEEIDGGGLIIKGSKLTPSIAHSGWGWGGPPMISMRVGSISGT